MRGVTLPTFRTTLWFVLPLLGTFIVTMTVIRAQPYTPPDGLDAILPPDCERACLMGIVPGETTIDEAVALLEAHPYVETDWIGHTEPMRMWHWKWKWGEIVPGVSDGNRHSGGGWVTYDVNGIVYDIHVEVSMSVAETRLLFGPPDVLYKQMDVSGDGWWFLDHYAETTLFVRHSPGMCVQDFIREAPFKPGVLLVVPNPEDGLAILPAPRASQREPIPCVWW